MTPTDPVSPAAGGAKARTIQLGALCDSLQKQIGDLLPKEKIEMFDHMADAITTCYVHGLIGDAATNAAQRKLMKKIHAAIANPPAPSLTAGR